MSTVNRSRRGLAAAIGAAAFAMAAALGGCASTSAAPAFSDVQGVVAERSGHRVAWNQDTPEDHEAEQALDRLMAGELSVDGAVQAALLGNPALRATFEELSLAQADLVQAGLLKNPTLGVGSTAWEQEHISPNLFATLEQDFLDLVTLPLRKRVAAAQLEAAKLRVGDQVLMLAAETRSAFFAAQAAEQSVAVRRLINEAGEAAAELARRQTEAGNMSDLALSAELSLASRASLDLKRSEGDAAAARERLNKVMGAWGARTGYRLAPRLPELPADEVSLEKLEQIAIEKRLDIAASRREIEALDHTLSLARSTRWLGFLNVEVEAARLRGDGRLSFGPRASLELPIFDQKQAAIARMEALRRQSDARLRSLSIDVRSDVRAARARLVTARGVVEEYARVLVPAREATVRLSQQQYDAMLIGVYQLIAARQGEFEAYQEYIDALRDYWVARSDLERAIGTRLSAAPPAHHH
jgi:outer membrane protein, heavy metal efflux system